MKFEFTQTEKESVGASQKLPESGTFMVKALDGDKGVRVNINSNTGSATLMFPFELIGDEAGKPTEYNGAKIYDNAWFGKNGEYSEYFMKDIQAGKTPKLLKWVNLFVSALPQSDQDEFKRVFDNMEDHHFHPKFAGFVKDKFPKARFIVNVQKVIEEREVEENGEKVKKNMPRLEIKGAVKVVPFGGGDASSSDGFAGDDEDAF